MNRFLIRIHLIFTLAFICLAPFARAQTNVQYLFNVNFAPAGSPARVGMAATYNFTNDFWNNVPVTSVTNLSLQYTYWSGSPTVDVQWWGAVTNLVYADNTNSPVLMYITNLTSMGDNGFGNDILLKKFASMQRLLLTDYDDCFNEIKVWSEPKIVLKHLPTNTYDLYVYGVGMDDEFYGTHPEGFTITYGATTSATKWTAPVGINTNWTENVQYVKFTNIVITSGDDLAIALHPSELPPMGGNHQINGFQLIIAGGGPTNAPAPTIAPASGAYTNALSLTITNSQAEATYKYKIGNGSWFDYTAPISLNYNATVVAQAFRHGNLPSAYTTNTYTFPDNDGDGISDAVEYQIGTNPANGDTDYDGRTDGQEYLTDFTDPLDDDDVTPVRLAYFKFSDTDWWGVQNQVPLIKTNLQSIDSWDGKALRINTNVVANLRYKDVETSLQANINCQKGTVRFWYKPDWSGTNVSGGTGPGVWSRLVELGAYSTNAMYGQWVLGFNPEGTELLFSTQGGGVETNLIAASISFTSNVWHHIALTYTGTNTVLYIDGAEAEVGNGIANFPSAAVRAADGLNTGSDKYGTSQALGMFDELETFNYPLTDQQIFEDYNPVATRDSDGDGVTDIKEHEAGTNWLVSDLPFFVLITQPKAGSIIP